MILNEVSLQPAKPKNIKYNIIIDDEIKSSCFTHFSKSTALHVQSVLMFSTMTIYII